MKCLQSEGSQEQDFFFLDGFEDIIVLKMIMNVFC